MKNKVFIIIFTALCIFGFGSFARAQQEKPATSVRFNKSGILVEFKTQTDPPQKNGQQFDVRGSTQIQGEQNVTHRVFVDQKTGAVFGYDLQVEAVEGTNQFKLLFKPLSIKFIQVKPLPVRPSRAAPFSIIKVPADQIPAETKQRIIEKGTARSGNTIAAADEKNTSQESVRVITEFPPATKYPDSTIINDGATLALDVLVNPQTGVKIVDLIKVSSEAKQSAEKIADEQQQQARDFSPDAVKLSLKNFKVLINDQQFNAAENPVAMGSVTGTIIWLYLPERGRFIFSLEPRAGYDFRKIGVIEGSKISFKINGDSYELVSTASIFGGAISSGGSGGVDSGSWNLWVLHEPDFVPRFPGAEPISYLIGAADRIEYLIKKK